MPREKTLQATSEQKVAHDQLAIRKGAITEANSQGIHLSTLNAKANIKLAFSQIEEAKIALDELELGHAVKRLHRCLCRAERSLKTTWGHTQSASLANAGIKYASIAMAYMGPEWSTVVSHPMGANPQDGTCAQGHHTDVLDEDIVEVRVQMYSRGPEGCLLPHRRSANTLSVPQVQLAGPVLQVWGSTLQPVLRPSNLHQDSGTTTSMAQAHESTVVPLLRRYPHPEGFSLQGQAVCQEGPPSAHSCRVYSEPVEVGSGPYPRSGVHGGQVPDGPVKTTYRRNR